jgi:hypothetical protein
MKAHLGALCERVLNGHLIKHPGDIPPAAARSVDGDNGEPRRHAEMAPSNAHGRGTWLARVALAMVVHGMTFGGSRAEVMAVVGSPTLFQWWVMLHLSQR